MIRVINLSVIEIEEGGRFRHIDPMTKVEGVWTDTDISSEETPVKDLAATEWTTANKKVFTDYIDANMMQ